MTETMALNIELLTADYLSIVPVPAVRGLKCPCQFFSYISIPSVYSASLCCSVVSVCEMKDQLTFATEQHREAVYVKVTQPNNNLESRAEGMRCLVSPLDMKACGTFS